MGQVERIDLVIWISAFFVLIALMTAAVYLVAPISHREQAPYTLEDNLSGRRDQNKKIAALTNEQTSVPEFDILDYSSQDTDMMPSYGFPSTGSKVRRKKPFPLITSDSENYSV